MSYGDAYVNVWCNGPDCHDQIEIKLPFVYTGPMHTIGHYDHDEKTINKLVIEEGWIVDGELHFCSPECRKEAGDVL